MKFLITFILAVFMTTGVTLARIFTKQEDSALLYHNYLHQIFKHHSLTDLLRISLGPSLDQLPKFPKEIR